LVLDRCLVLDWRLVLDRCLVLDWGHATIVARRSSCVQ